MKKIYLLIAIYLVSNFTLLFAQSTINYCNSSRYDQEVFSNVNVTSNIVYGSNLGQGGGTTTLTMDIYQPDSDTAAIRPLIVWAHGGSFVGGTKADPDVVSLCQHFAKRGYVCASIEYRLGVAFPPSALGTTQAVLRAVQDMKAAVRYFRQDAATANIYKIDSEFIVAGGSSAGAFTAMHLAYLNEVSEIPAGIDTTTLGNLEGNSGNPGYRSTVNAVVNLCGALGDKRYLQPGDIPLCSMHGNADATVPYATAIINFLGIFPIMQVDGSYSINAYADSIGVTNQMYTFFGADHVPYLSSTTYMDTTVRFVSNFLYTRLGCTPTDPEPLPNTFNVNTSINEIARSFNVYPNPSSGDFSISLSNSNDNIESIRIVDVTGRIIFSEKLNSKQFIVDNNLLKAGTYFVSIKIGSREETRMLLKQ